MSAAVPRWERLASVQKLSGNTRLLFCGYFRNMDRKSGINQLAVFKLERFRRTQKSQGVI